MVECSYMRQNIQSKMVEEKQQGCTNMYTHIFIRKTKTFSSSQSYALEECVCTLLSSIILL